MSDTSSPESALARYHRQMLLPWIGKEGQRRLSESHALVVGCGALGSAIVDLLARAGVGTLTIVDRDIVELTNLQRQTLYDEHDVSAATPKAEAARARVARINSDVTVHAHIDDFNHHNAQRYAAGADVILDGLDNFETRYLLNDLAVAFGVPYIYGGAVAVSGVSMCVLPSRPDGETSAHASRVHWTPEQSTPCLRCVFPEAPPPGTGPTCDTAGVLGPLIMMIAAHQATQAIKLLSGHPEAIDRSLLSIDLWSNDLRRFDLTSARQPDCPCCNQRAFEFLSGDGSQQVTALCGRNSVQVSASDQRATIDLAAFARRLEPHGRFSHNRFVLRGDLQGERTSTGELIELTLFPNGRAIFKGVDSPLQARTLYARYIGM